MKLFRKAILIIHGFAGGTYDEENLANFLELDKSYDVYQFTLPGHARNLSKATKEEWIKYCEEKVEWLINNGYHKIYILGHSMGGVIATYLSTKYKEIKKIVLAAPAFQYLHADNESLHLGKSLKETPKLVKTYGTTEIISRALKLAPASLRQFIKLTKEYYDYPKDINCPLLIIQGKNDNLVPISSSKYVYESANTNNKRIVYVSDVTHDVFRSEKDDLVFNTVKKFFKGKLEKGEINYD